MFVFERRRREVCPIFCRKYFHSMFVFERRRRKLVQYSVECISIQCLCLKSVGGSSSNVLKKNSIQCLCLKGVGGSSCNIRRTIELTLPCFWIKMFTCFIQDKLADSYMKYFTYYIVWLKQGYFIMQNNTYVLGKSFTYNLLGKFYLFLINLSTDFIPRYATKRYITCCKKIIKGNFVLEITLYYCKKKVFHIK